MSSDTPRWVTVLRLLVAYAQELESQLWGNDDAEGVELIAAISLLTEWEDSCASR